MSSTLHHLPEEIVLQVIDHLRLPSASIIGHARDPDFSKLSRHDQDIKLHLSTLASLCRSSKTFNRITKPLLYEIFPGFRIANARLFTKALVEDPVLAQGVQGIVIDKWEHIADGGHGVDRSNDTLEQQCMRYAADLNKRTSCYPMGMGSIVGSELDSGRADVVITMLMVLCPNIENLEISVPVVDESMHREAFLQGQSLHFLLDSMTFTKWTEESPARYKGVRSMSIRLERHCGTFGTTFSKRLLQVGHLEHFSAWRVHCGRLLTGPTGQISEPAWPGLRTLQLRECRLDNVMVNLILLRAPNLRVLDLHWAAHEYPLAYPLITETLQLRGQHLEAIKLDTRQNFCHMRDGDGKSLVMEAYPNPIGDLSSLTNLKTLSVTPRALIGFPASSENPPNLSQTLPAGLRELEILGPTREDPNGSLSLGIKVAVGALLKNVNKSAEAELRKVSVNASAFDWNEDCLLKWPKELGDWERRSVQEGNPLHSYYKVWVTRA